VRSMAREFHTRIELRQIGVRDEAKLKADYGDCGKPVCCNTHMVVMPPVSMRMAKLQKSTLDPSKISGRCGRLKCCLRFEQDVYEDDAPDVDRHVSGGELLRGACELAVREFGMMAPVVFRQWGIRTTDDFGELVFRLIRVGELSKSEDDDPGDFHEVFDLEKA